MSNAISLSFRLNLTVMKYMGLYPPEEHSNAYRIYSIVIFSVSMLPTFALAAVRFLFAKNVAIANYNDFALFGIMIYTFKLPLFIKRSKRIKECIQYFGADDYAAAKSEHEEIIRACVAACRRNSRVYFCGCVLAAVVLNGQALLVRGLQTLPLNVWLPDTFRTSPLTFLCTYFILILGSVYSALSSGAMDPLVGSLCHHASAQLQILKHRLRALDRRPDVAYAEIKKCVRRYQDIVSFVAEYEECFSLVVFSQFTGSVLVIGMCCFQFSQTDNGLTLLFIILCLNLLFFQLFFYCYYGTLLIEENSSLINAIYMSRWYEHNERSKKALLILMERSKKPLVITAGKVLDLSLETFTLILRRSYSLVAVLKNM